MKFRPFLTIVCIALLTFTVATGALPYALADADAAIAVDPLFGITRALLVITPDDVRLPSEPVIDVGTPRAPPLAV